MTLIGFLMGLIMAFQTAAREIFLKGAQSEDPTLKHVSIVGLLDLDQFNFCDWALEHSYSDDIFVKKKCLVYLGICPHDMASRRIFELMDELGWSFEPTRKWRDWE